MKIKIRILGEAKQVEYEIADLVLRDSETLFIQLRKIKEAE